MELNSIPLDIWKVILGMLDIKHQASALFVCKVWQNVLSKDCSLQQRGWFWRCQAVCSKCSSSNVLSKVEVLQDHYKMMKPAQREEYQNWDKDLVASVTDFDEMALKENLLRGIYTYGFEYPSQVQGKAIMPLVSGKDVGVNADSGTGKTSAICIAILQNLNTNRNNNIVQALVVTATTESALQFARVGNSLGDYLEAKFFALVSPHSQEDISIMATHPHVVVATLGRMKLLIKENRVRLTGLKILCIDEMDQLMLELESVHQLLSALHKVPQLAFFSRTLSTELVSLAEKFLKDPVKMSVMAGQLVLEGIR